MALEPGSHPESNQIADALVYVHGYPYVLLPRGALGSETAS